MNRNLFLSIHLPVLSVTATLLFSAPAAEARKSTPAASAAKKKKTVAELLAQMKENSRGGQVKMKKGETALPQAQLGFSAPVQRNIEEIKPPRSAELYQREGGLKAEYEKILDQQINELYKLTTQYKTSSNRGELWLRLAELYVEKAAIIDLIKQDQYDQKLRDFQSGKTKSRPKLDLGEARDYNKKSLQLYEWFERDFPRDPKLPQALFFLGYNNFELGRVKPGVEKYTRLIKEFPKSPFVMEANFALGEHYFENENWSESYKMYSPLIKAKRHPLHTFAMYKGAWALYRLGKYPQGLNYIEYIIKSGRMAAEGELAGKRAVNRNRLENEALRDLVVFYAAVGDAEKAESYFSNMVPGDITPHMEKLANFYSERGNKDAAGIVLKGLIAKNPTGPKAFNYQYQIVQNYFYAKNSPRFKEELYRWIKDYDEKGAWFDANKGNKQISDDSIKLRETTLKNYTLQQHQTAQNSRAPYSQAQAVEAYRIYLGSFSSHPSAGDMHFYFGELLYDMGKFDEAATEYNWVVQNAPQNKFFNKAAVALIHAVEKGVPSDKEMSQKLGSSLDPVPLDPKVEKFIAAGKWYSQNFPQSEKNPEIQFRIGRLYYQSNHFDEAMETFKGIVQKHPRTKHAEYSANLILDIYSLKKDYVGLEKTGSELLANPAISDSKAGADIRGVLEKASFKRAQDLEGTKSFGEAAVQYEAFAKQNPKSDLVTQAYFNAGVNYEKSGQNGAALGSYQNVLSGKGERQKDLKLKAKRLSAKLHQDSGNFEEAARLFNEVARDDMKSRLAPNLIFTSAALYEIIGRNEEAIKLYGEFVKLSKKHQERLEAVYSMAQLHRKARQTRAAISRFEEFIDGGAADAQKVMEAQFRLMELYEAQNKDEEALSWRKKVISVFKRLPAEKKKASASFAAKAKMRDAKDVYAKYRAVKLSADPSKLKKTLDEKLLLLRDLKRTISDVIEFDSAEEIVSGLTFLGQAYQNMGESLSHSPIPPGLNADEKKMYKEKVEKELAEPQYKEAREAMHKAVEKAWELEAYPPEYKTAFDYMKQVDAKTYYDGGENALESRLVNWSN